MANTSLTKAKAEKNDEFYTSKEDGEKELSHYTPHFKGKRIYCNCDDPFESCFPQIFGLNFKKWGLESLTCTCYGTSKVAGKQMSLDNWDDDKTPIEKRKAFVFHISKEEGQNINSLDDLKKVLKKNTKRLEGNGDFRSKECLDLLDQSDIVVTNPPFSLFREFIATMVEHNKQFLVIGNVNAVTYKEIFPLIKERKLWLGASIHSGDREFRVPDSYPLNASGCRVDSEGVKYIRVKGVRWFTNLDYYERYEELLLWKEYSPEEYPKYDNYDAINVDKTSEIPTNYDGVMGVPITFLDKYNPEQFEIVGGTANGQVPPKYKIGNYRTYNNPFIKGTKKFQRILIKRK